MSEPEQIKLSEDNVRLSMKERLGYGVGDFANNMMFAPVNSFMTYFFTNVAGIGAGIVGTLMLISRLLDGISDLVVGVLMEKVKSKHGKARPWLLWWCVPYAISLVLLFSAPDLGMTGKIIYAFLTYNLAVTIVYTAINLPFGTLAALMTKNQQERGFLNVSKMTFAFAGGLFVNVATLPLVDLLGGGARGWQYTFLIYGIIALVLFLVVFFSTKERVVEDEPNHTEKKRDPVDIKAALQALFRNKYWLILLAVFFLNSFGNALIGVNVYYAQYIMNDTGLVGGLAIYQTIASFATFAVVPYLLKRMGKQKIAFWGTLVSFLGYGLVILAPTDYMMLYATALIKGVGNAALSAVCYGMLADTVEYQEWKSGHRTEGLVFSANSIGAKIGSGLGVAALGWILSLFGFISQSDVQSVETLEGIRFIFLYVPVIVFALMAFILKFYYLDREYDDVVADLERRKEHRG